ncbi:ATP-binding protein [Heliophilum fasciatum]|uniref:Histidine kinase-like protein n=1 Tax=Heliophilum fasciatum TaxID=35700 RepID=A0A4R2RCF5_9FIRM|nr:ATP-binding protein [Heliophilum fasciatum]MCW2279269.1 serine/threonine-protein kinase RsbW [Heliophilum fasciatum]TCP60483.1 histidine kinase-like protein [Heliophilum fasciatum]
MSEPRLDVHICMEAVPLMIDLVDAVCTTVLARVDFAHTPSLVFAIHEAVINAVEAVQHAACEQDRMVSVRLQRENDSIVVEVKNRATAKAAQLNDWLTTNSFFDVLWKSHGRGLLLIRHMVDELDIRQCNEEVIVSMRVYDQKEK